MTSKAQKAAAAVLAAIEDADNMHDQAASLAVYYLNDNWKDDFGNDDDQRWAECVVSDLRNTAAILTALAETAEKAITQPSQEDVIEQAYLKWCEKGRVGSPTGYIYVALVDAEMLKDPS